MSLAKPGQFPRPPEQSQNHDANKPLEATSHKVGLGIEAQDASPSEAFPTFISQPEFQYNASLHPLDTTASQELSATAPANLYTPITGLRLQTDLLAEKNRQEARSMSKDCIAETPQQTVFNAGLPVRHSSIRSSHSARARRADSLSPGSVVSSPGVGALVDMTPLPSPISTWGSPGNWRISLDEDVKIAPSDAQTSRTSSDSAARSIDFMQTSPKKRKIPFLGKGPDSQDALVYNANAAAHARNRSLSDYVPDGMQVPKSRNIVVSTSGTPPIGQQFSPPDEPMHREAYLAVQRGLAIVKPPTPPDSNRGSKSDELERPPSSFSDSKISLSTVYEAQTVHTGRTRRWRSLRQLGEGQFSRVMLATSEGVEPIVTQSILHSDIDISPKSLVAIKICEQGPTGGADEQKVEVSIRREVAILKSINHPSLVHLKAVSEMERRTLLVLNYCPGGDLFELASTSLESLTPQIVRRIFAELVEAVRYLHLQYIVHRDIKLESKSPISPITLIFQDLLTRMPDILVNLPIDTIRSVVDWQNYASPVVTLTDLGLGKWIPKPPESPLLSQRCGSEDYAAPEVLMGQDYDGRATDAWALGVVLYSLMEGRMPFDPVPGSRRKSPTSHKIARCEWQWVKWADADGEWDATNGKTFEGAREIVEGLLARTRSRWSLEKVQQTDWVSQCIKVDGGLRREDQED